MKAPPGILEKVWVSFGLITTAAVTLWAAYDYGREISHSDQVLIGGLAPNGLLILGLGLTMIFGMFAGPTAMRRCWTDGNFLFATVAGLAWLGACACSVAIAILINPLDLSVLQPSSTVDHIVAVCWTIYVLLMSGMTATVLGVHRGPAAPNDALSISTTIDGAPRQPGRTRERLLSVLQELARRPPGQAGPKVLIADDSTIITSQGVLAGLADLSKSTVNRGLEHLQQAGSIDFETSNQETRIKVLKPQSVSGSERNGTA